MMTNGKFISKSVWYLVFIIKHCERLVEFCLGIWKGHHSWALVLTRVWMIQRCQISKYMWNVILKRGRKLIKLHAEESRVWFVKIPTTLENVSISNVSNEFQHWLFPRTLLSKCLCQFLLTDYNLKNNHMVNKLSMLGQISLNYKLVKVFYN